MTCVHCGESLWSETHRNGRGLYREQRGARQDQSCPEAGHSAPCEVIDEQAAEVFGKLVLPADWRAEIERRAENYERMRTVEQERAVLNERLRRLTTAYTMGNMDDDEYRREQGRIKHQLAGLRIPELEEALAAGELLEDLGKLWTHADVGERHDLLKGMVSRVYVDLLTRRLVGVTPKPAFWSLFESVRVASPRVLLLKPDEVKRRLAELTAVGGAGGDGGELNSPSR